MFEVILLIIGTVAGFCLYKIIITSDARQSLINNKISAFDSIIESWSEVRYFILANHKGKLLSSEAHNVVEEMHKNSQQIMDKLYLSFNNQLLADDINAFNESIYRNEWDTLDSNQLSAIIDQIKIDSNVLATRMRKDINNNYQLEWQDLKASITGLCSKITNCEPAAQTNNESFKNATTSSTPYKDDWIEELLKSKFKFLKDWDIRSLSRRRKATVAEEPVTESKPNEEAPPYSSPDSSPDNKQKADSTTESNKPKKTESAKKPKKAESSAEDKTAGGEKKTASSENRKSK